MVIYIDVLFVVNFFITYLLLLLTAKLSRRELKQLRLIAASAAGGIYSFVILIDDINTVMSIIGKLLASVVIIFISFSFKRLGVFLKTFCVFYFSNMMFLGIISALYLWLSPKGITVNNSNVYFDFSAASLLGCAFSAYVISALIIKIYNHTLERNEIYSIEIINHGTVKKLYAFADSGNKLKEPFTDYPVIIADKSKISEQCDRIIPYNTVAGEGVLMAFKPDKVIISDGKNKKEVTNVYIAVSDVDSKDFSAILNPELIKI